jgi:hypothetical protein
MWRFPRDGSLITLTSRRVGFFAEITVCVSYL